MSVRKTHILMLRMHRFAGHFSRPEPNLGLTSSLFTYIHHTVTFLTYLWFLFQQREKVMFHAKEYMCGTSEGLVFSSVIGIPSSAVVPQEETRVQF